MQQNKGSRNIGDGVLVILVASIVIVLGVGGLQYARAAGIPDKYAQMILLFIGFLVLFRIAFNDYARGKTANEKKILFVAGGVTVLTCMGMLVVMDLLKWTTFPSTTSLNFVYFMTMLMVAAIVMGVIERKYLKK